MAEKLPPIYFYIPASDWPADGKFPESIDTSWEWQISRSSFVNRKYSGMSDGMFSWVLQTYLHLKQDGFPCQLTKTVPDEGIVVAFRKSLPEDLKPKPKMLIVCIKADKEPHTYAQLHIVENPYEEIVKKPTPLWESYYIPLWLQPGLKPRDPARGDRFENVAFFGLEVNLAPELRTSQWVETLKSLGLNWQVMDRDRWHDYREVDAVLAVRSFDRQEYNWKPPSKLFNCWQAGVPAILGCESAYQAERKSNLDYIEVPSLSDAISALQRLRDDKDLRQAMAENGRIQAEAIQPEKMIARWRNFLTDVAVPAYERWCSTSRLSQQRFLFSRYVAVRTRLLRSRIRKMRGQFTRPVKLVLAKFTKN